MQLTHLSLKTFRNIDKLDLSFPSNTIVFYGLNGQGKTNIAEAIYLLATANSFRANYAKELIQDGKEISEIIGTIKSEKECKNQKVILLKNGKACFINGIQIPKTSDYISSMHAVCFSPDDVSIFSDSPSTRRHFLDQELSSLFPLYIRQLIETNKFLEKRNELLKHGKNLDRFLLEILDDKLIESSYDIFIRRKWFIERVEEIASQIIKKIFDDETSISIQYCTFLNEDDKDAYLLKGKKLLQESLEKDIYRQYSNVGIHRDDIKVSLNGKELDIYGSQGQNRIVACVLKLACAAIITKVMKDPPILILDDAFSELDKNKVKKLLEYVIGRYQVFITCTDKKALEGLKNEQIIAFYIKDGKASERAGD